MLIREINVKDKDNYIQLQRKLDDETIYMAFEKDDRDKWVERVEGDIKWFCSQDNSAIWVAEENDSLIGFLQITQHGLLRTSHIGTVFIGLLQESTGKKIGTRLFENLFEWCKNSSLTRLELTVVSENKPAIGLYKKMGFEIEGERQRSFKISDKYYSEFSMAKLL